VRKAVFDMLAPVLPDARVLDCCAGTGAMGIEALSRGAATAVFVEQSRRMCAVIRQNLVDLGISERCSVVCKDALRAASILRDANCTIALLDPPYRWSDDDLCRLLSELRRERVLADNARVVCERPLSSRVVTPAGFHILREKVYGTTRLAVLVCEQEDRP